MLFSVAGARPAAATIKQTCTYQTCCAGTCDKHAIGYSCRVTLN